MAWAGFLLGRFGLRIQDEALASIVCFSDRSEARFLQIEEALRTANSRQATTLKGNRCLVEMIGVNLALNF